MSATAPPNYPLLLQPVYKEKIWGGRTLERLGRTLPENAEALIGESWELVDLAQTSASGGGGGAEASVVRNGPCAGQTLTDLIAAHGDAVLGDLPLSPEGGFPLLLKYLDASQNLSVQVHPSASYAAANDDAFLKSEAWYIVDCEPGAVIYKGIQEGVTPGQLRDALAQNTDEAVVPLMITHEVRPGDIHYLPSGTCHALGGGILVAEVQTPSDTTFRVYDWGRTGRELHVDQAIECIDFGPADTARYQPGTVLDDGPVHVTRLVICEHFRIDRVNCRAGRMSDLPEQQPAAVMVLEGQVEFSATGSDSFPAGSGDTALIPASAEGATLRAGSGATWLEVTFPQAGTSRLA